MNKFLFLIFRSVGKLYFSVFKTKTFLNRLMYCTLIIFIFYNFFVIYKGSCSESISSLILISITFRTKTFLVQNHTLSSFQFTNTAEKCLCMKISFFSLSTNFSYKLTHKQKIKIFYIKNTSANIWFVCFIPYYWTISN